MTSEEPVSGGGPTSEYKGASLETLTVVLAVISFLIVLVRGVARQRISRIVESTDILLPIALVSRFISRERDVLGSNSAGHCHCSKHLCTIITVDRLGPTYLYLGCGGEVSISEGSTPYVFTIHQESD